MPYAGVSVNGQIVSSGTFVLPIDDRARRAQPPDDLAVGALAGGRSSVGAERGRLARDVHVVLDRDRHAEERPPVAALAERVGLRPARPLGEHHAERVELRVEALDALQARVDELARRDLAGGDQLGLARGPGEDEVGGVHRHAGT